MFDDSLLDDETALARVDVRLRHLAESGARVRREAGESADAVRRATAEISGTRPRAVIAAGPDSRLLRAVLEPWCPVPFVAWPGARLPGWVGSLDLVVVLAPVGSDPETASGVAEAVRRGSQLVVACPERSLVADHAAGRDTILLPTVTGDQLATAVVVLELLALLDLAPACTPDVVADALDAVSVACSPFRDLAVNPAKNLAGAIADTNPLLWGGTVLAARAGRRVAESIRQATGRAALAADMEHLLPVIEGASVPDVFADPFADARDDSGDPDMRPSLVILDDGSEDAAVRESRSRLAAAAERHGVRLEAVTSEADGELARYASLLATGQFTATYLDVGLG
ncbi:MAG: SIS domain-containing protein [Marmoricola sp.]